MTCAKVTVSCKIISTDGQSVIGINGCSNPQAVCPRTPGEDYTKCRTVCDQQGHAEVQALRSAKAAGISLFGASARITGHTYACRECQEALYAAGVHWIRVE